MASGRPPAGVFQPSPRSQLHPRLLSHTAQATSSRMRTKVLTVPAANTNCAAPAASIHTAPAKASTPAAGRRLRSGSGGSGRLCPTSTAASTTAPKARYRHHTAPAVHRPVAASVAKARSAPRPRPSSTQSRTTTNSNGFINAPRWAYISGARPDTCRPGG